MPIASHSRGSSSPMMETTYETTVIPDITVEGSQLIIKIPCSSEETASTTPSLMVYQDDAALSVRNSNQNRVTIPVVQMPSPSLRHPSRGPLIASATCTPMASMDNLKRNILITPTYEHSSQLDSQQTSQTVVPAVELPIREQVLTFTQNGPVTKTLQRRLNSEKENKKQQIPCLFKTCQLFWQCLTSKLGLITLVILYTFLGAAIFDSLEDLHGGSAVNMVHDNKSNQDDFQRIFLRLERQHFLENGSVLLKLSELQGLLKDYENMLRQGSQMRYKDPWPETQEYWKWLLFCMTAYTTIGNVHKTVTDV